MGQTDSKVSESVLPGTYPGKSLKVRHSSPFFQRGLLIANPYVPGLADSESVIRPEMEDGGNPTGPLPVLGIYPGKSLRVIHLLPVSPSSVGCS